MCCLPSLKHTVRVSVFYDIIFSSHNITVFFLISLSTKDVIFKSFMHYTQLLLIDTQRYIDHQLINALILNLEYQHT